MCVCGGGGGGGGGVVGGHTQTTKDHMSLYICPSDQCLW